MRTGDFSKLTNANGDLIRIFDPHTGRTDSTGAFVRDAFPGNIIPANRINPVAANIAKIFPIAKRSRPAAPARRPRQFQPALVFVSTRVLDL